MLHQCAVPRFVPCGRGARRANPALLFAARVTPSSCFPASKNEGMERRKAHRECRTLRGPGAPAKRARLSALHLRFRAAVFTPQHRPQVRASWDAGSAGVTRLALSQSSEHLAERSYCRPAGSRGLPGAWLRTTRAGAAHRGGNRSPRERERTCLPARNGKAGAVLRAGPFRLLHLRIASRSAPHRAGVKTLEMECGRIRYCFLTT